MIGFILGFHALYVLTQFLTFVTLCQHFSAVALKSGVEVLLELLMLISGQK